MVLRTRSPGTVAAGDQRTAQVGAHILRAGGNAVDAAVGACFAAFVAEPVLTGPFGGGFANVAGGDHRPQVFDFFANAPGLGLGPAREQPQLDFGPVEVDFGATTQAFHVGRGSVAATPMLDGLIALQAQHGALSLRQVVAPAQEMAAQGVEVSRGIAAFFRILEPILRLTPAAAELYAPGGTLLQEGHRFVNPALARLLDHIAHQGKGPSPEPLLQQFAPPAGRLTAEDVAAAQVEQREPIEVELAGRQILLTPPPSSGGLMVAFGLRLLQTVPPSVWKDELQTALHLIAAMAVTNAARAEGIDAALHRENLDGQRLAADFLGEDHMQPWRERFARAASEGPVGLSQPLVDLGSTTHISAVDASGLCCAITSSNGEGCGWVVPGTGALANNFMGEEDLHPQGFHLHPPGRRLTSMMCPTVVLHRGKPDVVLGTGGSNRIRTALLQVLTHHILRGLPIAAAVHQPRFHYEGRCLFMEARGPGRELSPDVLQRLEAVCHETVVFEAPNMFFGGVHAVDGAGSGVGDPRRSGAVAVA